MNSNLRNVRFRKLKVLVARSKSRIGKLKAREEAIKPRVK